jgi:UDP-N-acetyl-D-glucosamine dehydrogenase
MKNTARLRRRILAREARIAIIGQGYVGLTLACDAAQAGFPVTGVDIDGSRIADLDRGLLSVPGVWPETFAAGIATDQITFSTSADAVADADVILICVPTPVRDQAPDLTAVTDACTDVAAHLAAGSLVVLESTTYPGTTEDLVRPILEKDGLVAGRDFLLAYSPERIDPGNPEYSLSNTPKVVGGLTPESTGVASLFYQQLVEKTFVVSSCRAAELTKLLENGFRHVNIAFVNEMAVLCREMGIDVWEVIAAAATKPFGFMPFTPGPGVGGHCIPLDSTYLAWQVRRQAGRQFRILEQAEDVNAQMPAYVATRIGDALNDLGRALKSARVLVLGVSYKADVGDIRESPALRVMSILARRGADVSFHDPFLDSVNAGEVRYQRSDLSRQVLMSADCVALLTPHSAYDLDWIAEHAPLVFDARNAYEDRRLENVVRL